jgi:hypothetical protein
VQTASRLGRMQGRSKEGNAARLEGLRGGAHGLQQVAGAGGGRRVGQRLPGVAHAARGLHRGAQHVERALRVGLRHRAHRACSACDKRIQRHSCM